MPDYNLGPTNNPNCWPLSNSEFSILNAELMVYPNPATDKMQITNASLRSKKDLYNSVGQLIFSTTKNEMDISSLSKGVYYLRCESKSKKVIIE